MAVGRTPRAATAAAARVTKTPGMNRFVWDVRHQAGLAVPPGGYQARLKVGEQTLTQPFNVLIDPNVAADGVTVADLKEQFDHNMRMRELVVNVNQLISAFARRRRNCGTRPAPTPSARSRSTPLRRSC